jgi:hypothetical protein
MSNKIFFTAVVLVTASVVGTQSANAQSFSVGGFAGAQVVSGNNEANSSITVLVSSPSNSSGSATVSGSANLFGASAQTAGFASADNSFSSNAGTSAFSQFTNSKFTNFPNGASTSSTFFKSGNSFGNGFTNFSQ